MNAIEMKNVTKHWPGYTLQDLTWSVPEGMIMGLVGENGAGKSTIMRILLGMIRQDSGTAEVLGQTDLRAHPEIKEEIGVVMDDVNLPSAMKMNEIGMIMKGIYKNWDEDRYRELIRTLKIPEDKTFSQMSRGNKMKAGIACAMSHRPRLLLLDEATSGLDPVVRDELLDILLDFTREENHTILLSSHIVSDLEKVCDYVSFLHEGKMILVEEKDRIKELYGTLHCTAEELAELDPEALVGTRTTPYGIDAIVRKDRIPEMETGTVDIEDLFVFMVKGDKK